MTTKKPSQPEDEFFAKQDALARHKAAVAALHKMEQQEREALRELHYMKCPKCGYDLYTTIFHGVSVEKCAHCSGTWLDVGELEQLAGKPHTVLQGIVDLLKPGR